MTNFYLAILFAFIFAVFDVIGFRNATDIPRYRIIQIVVQISLIIFAYLFFGWRVSTGFSILWWFWNCDLIYYFVYDMYALFFKKPTGFKNEVLGNLVTWAGWSPFGLFRMVFFNKSYYDIIKGYILLIQAVIGIIITYIICII